MTDTDNLAAIDRHWTALQTGDEAAENEIYADDAVLEYPQSGERFRGRGNIQGQRGHHPARREFRVRRVRGCGDLWISEVVVFFADDEEAAAPLVAQVKALTRQVAALRDHAAKLDARARQQEAQRQKLTTVFAWLDAAQGRLDALTLDDARWLIAALGVRVKVYRKGEAPADLAFGKGRWDIELDVWAGSAEETGARTASAIARVMEKLLNRTTVDGDAQPLPAHLPQGYTGAVLPPPEVCVPGEAEDLSSASASST